MGLLLELLRWSGGGRVRREREKVLKQVLESGIAAHEKFGQ